jgi:hypothetical protein
VAEGTGLTAELLMHGYVDYSAEGDVSGPEADEPVRSGAGYPPTPAAPSVRASIQTGPI